MTVPHESSSPGDADDDERHPCPRCTAGPGSPCCSRSGAGTYHTGRFKKVPASPNCCACPPRPTADPASPGGPAPPCRPPSRRPPRPPTSASRGEIAYFHCYNPREEGLSELVRVIGSRWPIEECFEAAKQEAGLDQYQFRLYHAWYRHVRGRYVST